MTNIFETSKDVKINNLSTYNVHSYVNLFGSFNSKLCFSVSSIPILDTTLFKVMKNIIIYKYVYLSSRGKGGTILHLGIDVTIHLAFNNWCSFCLIGCRNNWCCRNCKSLSVRYNKNKQRFKVEVNIIYMYIYCIKIQISLL